MKTTQSHSLLLVLTALIWGIAFVAQEVGGDLLGPYTLNCIRFLIGALVLLPVIRFIDKKTNRSKPTAAEKKALLKAGIGCGIALFAGSTFQQLALYYGATSGKAGFLTTFYILIVPIAGLFFHRKCGWNIWVGVVIALIGMYLLCMTDSFTLQNTDILLLICAGSFSVQIMLIDHFAPYVDGVRLSATQFLVCGLISAVPMYFCDMGHSMAGFLQWLPVFTHWNAWIPILYTGVCSSGIGYTLQVIGQKGLNPTIASIIMGLESVFSALAGWLILHEVMTGRETCGCVLIFAAVVLAQLPIANRAKKADT